MALASIASVVAMILSSRVRWHEGTFAFGLASLASISAGFFLLMARGIEATSRPESARVALYVLALLGSLAAGIAAVLAVLHAMEGPLW